MRILIQKFLTGVKYEREDRYLKMLAQAKEVDKRKNSLISQDDSIDD